MQHSGHPSPTTRQSAADHDHADDELPPADKTIMDSILCLPADVNEFVKQKLLESTPTISIRKTLVEKFGPKYGWVAIAETTWRNILKKVRQECGLSNDNEQVSHLIEWMQDVKSKNNALSLGGSVDWDIKTDIDQRCECLFFMNDLMKEDFRRNGQFLVIDTTAKTNCFGMFLVVISVVNQEKKCAMVSTGLIRKESSSDFSWFMERTKSAIVTAYGQSVWDQVDAVCTDGDPCFPTLIQKYFPQAIQMRCMYHIQQNILKNAKTGDRQRLTADLYKLRLIDKPDEWDDKWNEFLSSYEATKNVFIRTQDAAGQEFHKPNARRVYLVNQLEHIKQTWCLAYINGRVTFGYMATTIAESVNAQIKRIVKNGSNLLTVFKAIHSITIDTHQQSINAMNKQREKIMAHTHKKNSQPLCFSEHLMLHLTSAAARMVEEEYKFIDNYRSEVESKNDSNESDNIFSVSVSLNNFMRTSDSERIKKERKVVISSTTMKCGCHHPATFLLPCRHILSANRVVFGFPFLLTQVHDRWKGQTLIESINNTKKFTSRIVDLNDAKYISFISFFSHHFPSNSPTMSKDEFEQKHKELATSIPDTSEATFTELMKSSNMVLSLVANTPSEKHKFTTLMLMFNTMIESFKKGQPDAQLVKDTISHKRKRNEAQDPPTLRRSGRHRQRRSGAR
jgi:hypothetical protein